MNILFLLEPDGTIQQYVLVYSIIYLILTVFCGIICFTILNLRKKSKKVNDLRYNLALSLNLSSIITCLSIPVITYFTHYHSNPFYALPHNYIFDVSLLFLYTLTLPFVFFLVVAIGSFIWFNHRRKVLLQEFRRNYSEKKSAITAEESLL